MRLLLMLLYYPAMILWELQAMALTIVLWFAVTQAHYGLRNNYRRNIATKHD